MADTKISALTGATTPLAGTEVVPLVQSGTTKNVSVDNLTAGRAVSAAQLDVDNIRIDANTLSSTNTNGAINITPNGVGAINLTTSDKVLLTNATTTASLRINAAGTGTNIIAAANRGPSLDLQNTQNTDNTFSTIDFRKSDDLSIAKIAGQTVSQTGRTGKLSFMTANGAGPAERLTISAAGDVTAVTGNLVIGTNGKGIDFSATADGPGMTSELLDDYEIGTWTPTLSYSTPGTLSITYTTQSGTYTKIGNTVSIHALIVVATFTKGTASGSLRIEGLPFTSNATYYGNGSLNLMSYTYSNIPYVRTSPGTTNANLRNMSSGTSGVLADPSANAEIYVSLVYQV